MAFVLGLTGSFGSGKSAVAGMLREAGAAHIDADALARQAVAPGRPALDAVVREFGEGVIAPDGSLDRRWLGERVFRDWRALARLNAIIHPEVRREEERLIEEWSDRALIVLDVPLLFEAGARELADKVAVVAINERQRFARLRRRGFSEREIVARLGMQMAQARKLALADYVIDNSGSLEATRKQVWELIKEIGVLNPSPIIRQE